MTKTPTDLPSSSSPVVLEIVPETGLRAPLESASQETPSHRRRRHARRVGLYISATTFIGVFVLLVALAAANTRAVRLDWLVGSTQASLVWIILAAAGLGWLLGATTAIVVHHRTRNPDRY